ncbi:MAG: FAD-dependent oxidoreductase [Clostridiales bacterium]|nr:FAD-dependent oxidoreductase [Clostridiales bacterium]
MKYDVVIIGGGITGTAIAHELARFQCKTILLESGTDVAFSATKQNGGVIHPGYDPHPGTLKAKLNPPGARMFPRLSKELGFKIRHTGTLVVAYSDKDLHTVDELLENAKANGVEGVEKLNASQLRAREPHISDQAVGALLANTTVMVDPFEVAIAYMENAMENGVELGLCQKVRKIRKRAEEDFIVYTEDKQYETRFIVNAAGVHADDVAAMAGIYEFKMQGRHGNLCVLDKVMPIHTVMFPCPGPDTKGIALIPTVSGNCLIGSTATMREDKYDVTNDAPGIEELIEGAKLLIPEFDPKCIIRTFAGQRPVALDNGNDFYIKESDTVKGFIHAAGIQSPGIASSPAIAEYVRDLLADAGLDLKERADYDPYRQPIPDFSDLSLEEQDALIKEDSRWGKIVCRCETVPEGEIVAAIHRTLGARTVEGVKRRTRAGMGRCQSGFCQYKVMQILSRELGIPEEEVLFEEKGAQVLFGKIKG